MLKKPGGQHNGRRTFSGSAAGIKNFHAAAPEPDPDLIDL